MIDLGEGVFPELGSRWRRPASTVEVVDLVEETQPVRCVGQETQDRRLVRDDRLHRVGVVGEQLQRDDPAGAGAKDSGRFVGEAFDQPAGVVGVGS
ncbi:MAG: hypothetical protein JO272_05945 [Pseudonocardiales bacterium]|nr:hypothetical protein [Pseudonocardiales bacterium]